MSWSARGSFAAGTAAPSCSRTLPTATAKCRFLRPRSFTATFRKPSAADAGTFSGSTTDSGRLIDAPPPGESADDEADFEVYGEMVDDDRGDFDLGTRGRSGLPKRNRPVGTRCSRAPPGARGIAKKSPRKRERNRRKTPNRRPTPNRRSRRPIPSSPTNLKKASEPTIRTHRGATSLLRVALAEEAETGGRRRGQKVAEGKVRTGFRIYCPNGHCIEVQERHRGQTGRCPRCRELYHVPAGNWDEEKAQQEDKAQKAAAIVAAVQAQGDANKPIEISAGEYTRWMLDSHFHSLDLAKLKLKPGSLLKEFQEGDVGFAPDGMLIVLLAKKGGLFGGGDKKKLTTRDAVLDHLSKGKAREELPAGGHHFFVAADMNQLRIVQPIVSTEHSMFAGVPVFGEGQIAVRLPKKDEKANHQFLSFTLSQFRRFSKILDEFYGLKAFGAESGIPLEDVYTERHCHFSDEVLRILENLDYYKDDPGYKLKVIGYKCAGCGLVVSEDSRLKEKIGDKDAKKLAKAKCPKCTKPFGNLPLQSLDTGTAAT